MKIFRLVFYILFLLAFCLNAQDLALIKKQLDNQNYNAVISATDRITDFSVDAQPEVALIRGQAFYKIGSYQRAIGIFKLFEDEFVNSVYKIPSFYYLGICYVKTGDYKLALTTLATVEAASFKDLSAHAQKMLKVISALKLTEADINWLKQQPYNDIVNKCLTEAARNIHILVVLPTSGKSSKEGKELLDGLKYALNNLHANQLPAIYLDVVNSESNIALMQKRVIEKITSRRYSLIIGELKSAQSAALAGLASLAKIPLISPTATDNYISEISDIIYQLNCSSYTMGDKIALFAMDSMQMKTFAILSPVTPEGKEAVKGFINRVNQKGGKILAQEWFYETVDFSKQIQKIRESTLEFNKMPVAKYMLEDSIKKVAIGGLDGIFLPISKEDIKPLAPQIAAFNLTSNLLGTYGWDSPKELNKVSNNVDSLVFVKENSINPDNLQYIEFVNKHRTDTGRAPTPLEIIGYDTMLFYLQLLKNTGDKSLTEVLKQVQEFTGVYGKIKFESGLRSNSAVELYRYTAKNGIKRIGR